MRSLLPPITRQVIQWGDEGIPDLANETSLPVSLPCHRSSERREVNHRRSESSFFEDASGSNTQGSWPSTILISLCVGSNRGLLSVACARRMMGSVSSVIHMSAHVRSCGSAMSATMVHFREGVSSVEELGFPMPTIAKNAPNRRKTVMGVPRLSIWEVPKLIFSMKERNMDLRKDDLQAIAGPRRSARPMPLRMCEGH
ncbi:hypothetical protein C4D60_Mb09t01190 [Musa balbisiana]|uniref:Uncharacterized protein n=1 Tax=Musa balbisiana TaxID=52838 RepID=A0A4S8IDA4_MUSBA|nr:hypothetical protein C4D60_Mb09t01190 [Musa balbisiana]